MTAGMQQGAVINSTTYHYRLLVALMHVVYVESELLQTCKI
jgi:hypothetical protein